VLLVSAAANPSALAATHWSSGWLQMLGSVLGCLTIAGGLWLSMRRE